MEEGVNASPLNEISQRLAFLEREIRRWKALGVGAVAFLGLVLLLGTSSTKMPQEIRVKRLVLLDNDGQERAKLAIHAERGGPALELYHADGRIGVSLGVASTGGSLLGLANANESDTNISLTLGGDGGAGLSMSNTSSLILLNVRKGRTHARFSSVDAGIPGGLFINIPAENYPAGEGKSSSE